MDVRITVYHDHKIGNRGEKLIHGFSAAADQRLIPYGTLVTLSWSKNGKSYRKVVKVADTGPAVVKRTASRKTGRNEPIIDISFANRKDSGKFLKSLPKNLIVKAKFNKK